MQIANVGQAAATVSGASLFSLDDAGAHAMSSYFSDEQHLEQTAPTF